MFDITLFHPKIVHFTVALFSLAVLFDILGLLTKRRYFQTTAWLNLIFAGAAAVATVITGLLAASNVPHNDATHKIMETHETIGYFVLGVILVLLIWRILLKGNFPAKAAFVYVIIALAGVGLMFTGAYYGGEMVYTHGVAVKAVPVTEEEAGHHHDEGSGQEHNATIEEGHYGADSTAHHLTSEEAEQHHQVSDSLAGEKTKLTVHRHKDGSEHVHER